MRVAAPATAMAFVCIACFFRFFLKLCMLVGVSASFYLEVVAFWKVFKSARLWFSSTPQLGS